MFYLRDIFWMLHVQAVTCLEVTDLILFWFVLYCSLVYHLKKIYVQSFVVIALFLIV